MSVHTPMPTSIEPIPASPRSFLSLPTWIRAGGAETNGALSLIEQVIPPGFASPWHVHHNEDESFYVVEGKMTVVVGDSSVALEQGGYAFGPRGTPHGFRIDGTKPARVLLMTTGGALAAFVLEMSEPADGVPLTEPKEIDVPRLVAAAQKYGMSILGPMPL